MTDTGQHRPWQREPYVWMVIAFPAAAVIAGIITLILAIKSEDGLVVDDYYKQGLEINRILDRDHLAQEYQLEANIHYPAADNQMIVEIQSGSGYVLPDELSISLLHATRKGYDQIFKIKQTNSNQYIVPVKQLKPGRWHILIETDDWRLEKVIRVN